MARQGIRGITVQIGADTLPLEQGLSRIKTEGTKTTKELKNIEKALKFNPKNTELLAQKQQLLTEQVGRTSDKLNALKQAQEEVNRMYRQGTIGAEEYRKFKRDLIETESQLKNYKNQLKEVNTEQSRLATTARNFKANVGTLSTGMTSVGTAAVDLGSKLTTAFTMPMVALGTLSTAIGSEFYAKLSEVQALSGSTIVEMERFEEKARALGSSTKYSASEVTDGFKYMSLAGWNLQQSLDGIDGVLSLAASSGEELGIVSDILTDAISAFGDEAADASRYADVLSSTSASANTNVAMLGEAFTYVAPVAGALKYKLEDVSLALGLMANSGIKASTAGTSLRSAMTNMASPTKGMQNVMDELNLSLTDNKGNMKDYLTVMEDLRKGFKTLKPDEQAAKASELFGKEAMSGMLAVINASEADFRNLKKNIDESKGKAKEMADIMQDNLKGKINSLKSAVEELAIKGFNKLEPYLLKGVEYLQKFVDKLNSSDNATQKNILKLGAFLALFPPIIIALGTVLKVGGLVLATFLKFGRLASPIGLLTTGITVLAVKTGLVEKAMNKLIPQQNETTKSIKQHSKAVQENIDKQNEKIESTKKAIKETAKEEEQAINTYKANKELLDSYDSLIKKSKLNSDEVQRFVTLKKQIDETLNEEALEKYTKEIETLASKSGLTNDELDTLFNTNQRIIGQMPEAITGYDDFGNAIIGSKEELSKLNIELLEMELRQKRLENIKNMANFEKLAKGGKKSVDELGKAIEGKDRADNEIAVLKKAREELKKEKKEAQKEAEDLEKRYAAYDYNISLSQIEQARKLVAQQDTTLKHINNLIKDKKSEHEVFNKTIEKAQEHTANLTNAYVEIKQYEDSIYKSLATFTGKTFTKENFTDEIKKIMEEYNTSIKKLEELKLSRQLTPEEQSTLNTLNKELAIIKEQGEQLTLLKENQKQFSKEIDETNVLEKLLIGNSQLKNKELEGTIQGVKNYSTEAQDLLKKVDSFVINPKKIDIETSKDVDEENESWAKQIFKSVIVSVKEIFTGKKDKKENKKDKKPKAYARGTTNHTGGNARMGELGVEYVSTKQGDYLVSDGLYALSKGSSVLTANETIDKIRNDVVRSINDTKNIGKYTNRGYNKGEDVTIVDNNIVIKPTPIILDKKVVGEVAMQEIQQLQRTKRGVNRQVRTK